MPTRDTPGPSKAARTAALVRQMIHDGRLSEGDQLPSTRALAAELGVSRGTVVTAYEQLDGEGYLHTRHGAVSRVAATLTPRPVAREERAARPPGESGRAAVNEEAARERTRWHRDTADGDVGRGDGARAAAAPSDIVDLTPGLPRASTLATKDWRAALRHAAAIPLTDTFPDPAGYTGLRSQIAAHLGLGRGFAPSADRVLITSGTAEALSLLTEASRTTTGGRGPRVAVENPGYGAGRTAVVSGGGELVAVPVDDDGLRLDRLRAAHAERPLDAVMLTPSHQYPMGGVMPVAHRQELCEWAAAQGVLVIEDDYDSEFRHRGAPLPALAAVDAGGAVAHVGTFSKVLDPHLRCGYLVLPDVGPHADTIRAARHARGAAVATVLQHALTHLMATGALRRHIARCRRDYTHQRSMVAEALARVDGVRVRGLDGGLHAVLELEDAQGADPSQVLGAGRQAVPKSAREAGPSRGATLVARLAERGVQAADLQDYAVPGSGATLQGIVFGYGAVPAATLRRALDVICEEVRRG